MSQTIKLKRSAVPGNQPELNQLELGEVAINTTDGKMYIKKSVDGDESIVEVTSAQIPADPTFDSVTLTGAPGPIEWNSLEDTVDIPLNSDVTLQVGQETVFRAKATEAISNGQAVMFAGAQGDHLLVAKADMSAVGFEPEYVVGIATQDFAANDFGFVTTFGKVRGLNTAALSEGDILYLDPSVAGGLTTTKPTSPNHVIQMCAVVRSHLTQGTYLVRPTHIPDSDEIPEGSSNLYFTYERAVAAVAVADNYVLNTGDTINGDLNVVGDLYITASGDDGWRFRPGVNSGFQYGFADQHGNAQVFTNEQGTTNQAFILGDTNPNSSNTLFGVSVIAGGNNPTTGDEAWTKKLNLTGAGDLYIGPSGTSEVWHEGNFNPNNYLLASNYVDDYVTSASFNTTNGVLTLTRAEGGTVTVDLDGRYLQTETDNQTLSWNSTNGELSISGGNTIDLDGRYIETTKGIIDYGTTRITNMSTLGIQSGKYSWNINTSNAPAPSQSNQYGTLLHLNYDNSNSFQQAWDIDQGNLYLRTLNYSSDSGDWKKVWHDGNLNPSDYLLTSNYTNTTYNINAQDVSGGKAIRLTGSDGSTDDVTFAAGSNVTLTRSGDTITIASTDTNTNTWRPIHDAPVDGATTTSISSNWAFDNVKTPVPANAVFTDTETTTTLTKVGNELRYVNEAGTTQSIDLSLYLDDTNLARILSGTMNSSGIATFTRDDGTSFTVDMSVLLDDTNLSRIVSASWNTSNGVLTLTRNDSTTVSVDLDNRYLTSYTETDTLQSVTSRGATTDRDILISKDTATLNIRGTVNSANGAYLRLTESGYQGAFIKYEADANKLYIGTKSNTAQDLSSEVTAISINRGSNSITVPGTVTAASFVGSINYSQITNPPVIDNSVDYINAASFNTGTGVLTLSGVGRAGATVDLDNRYLTSYSETDTLQSVTARGNTTTNNIMFTQDEGGIEWSRNTDKASIKFYNDSDGDTNSRLEFNIADNTNEDFRFTYTTGATTTELLRMRPDGGNNGITFRGHTMWHAGNFNPSNYLTSYTETDTLQSVTARGAVTNQNITIQNNTPSIILVDTETSNPSNQSIRIQHDGIDSNLPSGEGLALRIDSTDTSGTNTNTCIITSGELYANNTQKVWHAGNFNPNNYLLTSNYQDNYVDSVAFNTSTGVLTLGRTGSLTDLTVDLDGRYSTTDTNDVDYINGASFNTSNGVLTLSGVGRAGATVDLDNRYKLLDDTYRWELNDVSNISGSRWYKVATVNTGNGGLRIEGVFSNHVESFGTQKVDLSIFGREGGLNTEVEIAGSIDVGATESNTGILVLKADDSSVYHTFDVYVAVSRYAMVQLDFTKTGIINLWLPSVSNYVTTKPTGISTEFDGTNLSEGSYTVVDSQLNDNYHSGNLNPVTGLTHDTVNTELDVTFADGTTQSLDLSQYIDDTNLSRIVSGSHVGSGIVRFTRDDSSTFDVDFSDFFDDTNLARITSASWNTSNGVLTLTRNDSSTVTVDLDGRYLQSYSETDTLQSVTNRGNTTTQSITVGGTLRIGNSSSSSENKILFSGTVGENPGSYYNTVIGEYHYGETEDSELILYKGNDAASSSGPDRIRSIAANHVFDVYNAPPGYSTSLATIASWPMTRAMTITSDGNLYQGSSNRIFHDGYHPNADKWTTARTNTVTLTGDVTGSGSASVDGSGNWTVSVAADWRGGTANTTVNMNNFNIENVNNLTFNDPGPAEGLEWKGGSGWKIYESPDNLTTNSGGNLQFVTGSTRRITMDTSGNLNVTGTLTASAKSFLIDHPTKEGYKLRYGSLEGPENGVYVRGRLKGDNTIELPEYWKELVHEDSITVNLTPIGKGQDIWVEDFNTTEIVVGGENVNCFYTVYGERKDVDKLITEFKEVE